MFDDSLSAALFEEIPNASTGTDEQLARRATQADAVLPVRVATVTRETLADRVGYTLTLVPTEPAIVGRGPAGPLEVHVSESSPAFSQLTATGTAFVGRRLLLLYRRYDDGGEPKLHFRGEADTPEVRTAVKNAKSLDDLER